VRAEVFEARAVRFEHADLRHDRPGEGRRRAARGGDDRRGSRGSVLQRRRPRRRRWAGVHALWKNVAKARILDVDLREQVLDVAGQEIMTADKVTLRLNAVVTFKVVDPLKAVTVVEDYRQALYREASSRCVASSARASWTRS
jgi:regulator of protease activity HflC (stomatin/prohibitin superfamily)